MFLHNWLNVLVQIANKMGLQKKNSEKLSVSASHDFSISRKYEDSCRPKKRLSLISTMGPMGTKHITPACTRISKFHACCILGQYPRVCITFVKSRLWRIPRTICFCLTRSSLLRSGIEMVKHSSSPQRRNSFHSLLF
jgi:hypothetical protein